MVLAGRFVGGIGKCLKHIGFINRIGRAQAAEIEHIFILGLAFVALDEHVLRDQRQLQPDIEAVPVDYVAADDGLAGVDLALQVLDLLFELGFFVFKPRHLRIERVVFALQLGDLLPGFFKQPLRLGQ